MSNPDMSGTLRLNRQQLTDLSNQGQDTKVESPIPSRRGPNTNLSSSPAARIPEIQNWSEDYDCTNEVDTQCQNSIEKSPVAHVPRHDQLQHIHPDKVESCPNHLIQKPKTAEHISTSEQHHRARPLRTDINFWKNQSPGRYSPNLNLSDINTGNIPLNSDLKSLNLSPYINHNPNLNQKIYRKDIIEMQKRRRAEKEQSQGRSSVYEVKKK